MRPKLLPPPAINVVGGTLTNVTGTPFVYLPDTASNHLVFGSAG